MRNDAGRLDGQVALGPRLERLLDAVTAAITERPFGAVLLGGGLGLLVVAGGIATFLIVWAVLVGVLH